MLQHKERILLAQKSLLGVAVGDAFGDSFFGEFEKINTQIYNKEIPRSLYHTIITSKPSKVYWTMVQI